MIFPKDEAGFDIDDQYYIGSSGLLVKPVTQPGTKETSVYLAEDQVRSLFASRALKLRFHPSLRSTMTTSPTAAIAVPPRAELSLFLRIYMRSHCSCEAARLYQHVSARGVLRR